MDQKSRPTPCQWSRSYSQPGSSPPCWGCTPFLWLTPGSVFWFQLRCADDPLTHERLLKEQPWLFWQYHKLRQTRLANSCTNWYHHPGERHYIGVDSLRNRLLKV